MTRHECLSRVLPSLALGLKPVASVAPASRGVQKSNEAEFLNAELSGSAWPTWFAVEAFRGSRISYDFGWASWVIHGLFKKRL
jgi:hypothetical protein